MALKIVSLACGVAFGFVIAWARLTDYDVIHAMLRLREADVYLLMMSAMATAAVGVRVLRVFNAQSLIGEQPIRWNTQPPRRRHIVGSAIFGIGWSIAGTCPGPVAAQLGQGQLMALFTIGGVLAGIVIHDKVRARRNAAVSHVLSGEATTVAGM